MTLISALAILGATILGGPFAGAVTILLVLFATHDF